MIIKVVLVMQMSLIVALTQLWKLRCKVLSAFSVYSLQVQLILLDSCCGFLNILAYLLAIVYSCVYLLFVSCLSLCHYLWLPVGAAI